MLLQRYMIQKTDLCENIDRFHCFTDTQLRSWPFGVIAPDYESATS